MQWSFLVIYAKTIFSNISLANKTTSPIQNGRYKIDLRCSHDLLIDTISEVEHCKHQYLFQSIPIPIPNQVQPWRAGGHRLRDGALHHQDRHRRWFLPGVMLLIMFIVIGNKYEWRSFWIIWTYSCFRHTKIFSPAHGMASMLASNQRRFSSQSIKLEDWWRLLCSHFEILRWRQSWQCRRLNCELQQRR